MKRVVVPEILDSLPAGDPRARRSRRDLLVVDWFMGNTRWILRELAARSGTDAVLAEIGSGDGRLAARVCRELAGRRVVALDLAERPPDLDPRVEWRRGDFFRTLPEVDADACAGSLILHHFTDEALGELGWRMREFRTLVFCEPLRSRVALGLCALARPFAGEVTRHDMPASIRAGFVPGELAARLGLEPARWSWREAATLRGGLRFFAARRS